NVYIMDELHTIIACGAGAVTKLYNQKKGLINRIFNYKYPKEYIDGFDVILERRKGITDFYEI
ncbi:MAG: coproporphyrinogen dehydrogenase HemZ, partial [Oscillospiraceae bacterium]